MDLNPEVENEVTKFLQEKNLPNLYKSYSWKADTYQSGFPALIDLEKEISSVAREDALSLAHLKKIAKWGGHRRSSMICCPDRLDLGLYTEGNVTPGLAAESEKTVRLVESQVHGFGPTYSSKLLHFAVPHVFGALDTRLVRTFGRGDPASHRYTFLELHVSKSDDRWMIPSVQPHWPAGYGTWVGILNFISEYLNSNGVKCPHPQNYYKFGLRTEWIWLPADVETALFGYASKVVAGKEQMS